MCFFSSLSQRICSNKKCAFTSLVSVTNHAKDCLNSPTKIADHFFLKGWKVVQPVSFLCIANCLVFVQVHKDRGFIFCFMSFAQEQASVFVTSASWVKYSMLFLSAVGIQSCPLSQTLLRKKPKKTKKKPDKTIPK